MTAAGTALQTLGTGLCPWLRPAFVRLDEARRSSHLGHAWLIAGPAGVGKINLALAFAARLLDRHGVLPEPHLLEPRATLAAIAERHVPTDHHPDLHWLHPEEDKHSISIEQVRDAIESLALTAHGGGAKVVIVEPADAMTISAANGLLKTLEEPAAGTYLLLLSHQPGRLPATIRSRCQRIDVAGPSIEALGAWLGARETDVVAEAWHMVGGAPLATARLLLDGEFNNNNELTDSLSAICEDELDPQRVADAWARADTALALTWLTRQLHAEIKHRMGGSTSITDRAAAKLHNAWRNLTLRALFEQHDQAERLLGQLGSGMNVELALQALLGGFVMNRG